MSQPATVVWIIAIMTPLMSHTLLGNPFHSALSLAMLEFQFKFPSFGCHKYVFRYYFSGDTHVDYFFGILEYLKMTFCCMHVSMTTWLNMVFMCPILFLCNSLAIIPASFTIGWDKKVLLM